MDETLYVYVGEYLPKQDGPRQDFETFMKEFIRIGKTKRHKLIHRLYMVWDPQVNIYLPNQKYSKSSSMWWLYKKGLITLRSKDDPINKAFVLTDAGKYVLVIMTLFSLNFNGMSKEEISNVRRNLGE